MRFSLVFFSKNSWICDGSLRITRFRTERTPSASALFDFWPRASPEFFARSHYRKKNIAVLFSPCADASWRVQGILCLVQWLTGTPATHRVFFGFFFPRVFFPRLRFFAERRAKKLRRVINRRNPSSLFHPTYAPRALKNDKNNAESLRAG